MNTQTHNQARFAEATGPTDATTGPMTPPGAPTPGTPSPHTAEETGISLGTAGSPADETGSTSGIAGSPAEAVDRKGRPLAVVPARVPWPELGIFAVIAFGLAWVACLPLWISGEGLGDPLAVQLYGGLMMFTPLVASIVAAVIQRRRARSRGEAMASAPRYFGFWPLRPFGRVLWMTVAAFFGVMVLIVLGYLLSAAFGWLSLDLTGLSAFKEQLATLPGLDSVPTAVAVLGYLLLMLVSSAVTAFVTIGEEFGWRGWLLTSLRPLGAWPALLIVGAVWGLWHAPLILLGYNFNRPDIAGLGLMVAGCITLGFLFGWLRLRTGSVWPAVAAHAALNGSGGMLLGLFLTAGAPAPDSALVAYLGVAGWIISAIVTVVLVVTGQFRKQPELGIKKATPADAISTTEAPSTDEQDLATEAAAASPLADPSRSS